MKFSATFDKPLAIRYPRGRAYEGLEEHRAPVVYGKSEMIHEGREIAVAAVGSMVETAQAARLILKKDYGLDITLVNVRFVSPMDETCIRTLAGGHRLIVTMEENILRGGFGEALSAFLEREQLQTPVLNMGIPDVYVEHGNVAVLKEHLGLDAPSVADKIWKRYKQLTKPHTAVNDQ